MKNKLVVLMILMSLIITMIPTKGITQTDNYVDPLTAEIVAKNFLPYTNFFEERNIYSVFFHSTIYDIDDTPLAYYFLVEDANKETVTNGYIMVSATMELPPILAYGEDGYEDEFYEKSREGYKAYYVGGLYFLYAKDKKDLLKKFEEGKNERIDYLKKILQSEQLSSEEKIYYQEELEKIINAELTSLITIIQQNKQQYVDLWEKLVIDSEDTDFFVTSTTVELPVIHLYQYMPGVTFPNSACGPTTGAMIANYYKYIRGLNIDGIYEYGGAANFINHLWWCMSALGGTTMSAYNLAMRNHYNKNYSNNPFSTSSMNGSTSGSWTTYTGRINNQHPVALRFYNNDQAAYSYHWVAGVGYSTSAGIFFGVKDPGQSSTATRWLSWDVNSPFFNMALTYGP